MNRLLPLVDAAGLNDKTKLDTRYGDLTVKQLRDYAAGKFGGRQFYGGDYDPAYMQGDSLTGLARQLNCSTDFLLGLTDDPTPAGGAKEETGPRKCVTGCSTSGQCGAAAYCNKPLGCCIACDDPCNSRCGFLPEVKPKEKAAP